MNFRMCGIQGRSHLQTLQIVTAAQIFLCFLRLTRASLVSCGLPVVATDRSGSADCVTNGVDGVIVPVRSADALATAILWQYQNREATATMGKAARAKIEQRFTLSHYEERMISVYRTAVQGRYTSDHTAVLST